MAQALPINIPIPAENAIASYNFTDIASRQGYVTYYGSKLEMSGAMNLSGAILSTNQNISVPIYSSSSSVNNTADTWVGAVDFVLTYNAPANIKGNIICDIPLAMICDSNTTGLFAYIDAILYHKSGTVSTSIGTAVSEYLADTGMTANGTRASMVTLKFNIASVRHIKKGDSLHLVCNLHCGDNGANNKRIFIAHDPQGRTKSWLETIWTGTTRLDITNDATTNTSSVMKVYIPYVIDI